MAKKKKEKTIFEEYAEVRERVEIALKEIEPLQKKLSKLEGQIKEEAEVGTTYFAGKYVITVSERTRTALSVTKVFNALKKDTKAFLQIATVSVKAASKFLSQKQLAACIDPKKTVTYKVMNVKETDNG